MPDINDIFNYVMDTPDNTNPNVLRSMLNNLEEGGSGGGVLVVTCTRTGSPVPSSITADKTCKEIFDAYAAGTNVVFLGANYFPLNPTTAAVLLYAVASEEDGYEFTVLAGDDYVSLKGDTANDYPVWTNSL